MPLTIPVAHDFICPWCWVGFLQARRLQLEFGVDIEWLSYELMPDVLEWSTAPPAIQPANRPETLSRLQFLLVADGMEMPKPLRPKQMRTHNAHEAVQYARTEEVDDALVEALYRAYWEEGETINDPEVLRKLATGIVKDLDAMSAAIESRRFADQIVAFDDDAYASGVYNVPTFYIGGERYAEQPYSVLQKATANAVEAVGDTDYYLNLTFPKAPHDRPYVFINMVATIDGKTVLGTRDDSVTGLGSPVDHLLMKRIEAAADGIMVGAQTLRATSTRWNPQSPKRYAVTRSGDLPREANFFRCGGGYVVAPGNANIQPFGDTRIITAGQDEIDFLDLLRSLRQEHHIRTLLVSGGSELNAQLLGRDLVDELFLTIAPKVKLGKESPTYAGGEPLPKDSLLNFDLIGNHAIGNELFLRYRRSR